ncbi:hypothetical protein B9Z55_027832 [Caenorhabditis nigoni]|uniref:DUF38 domain-containing protein n=1 Tax=Caenorhabditis nigoni TaxID=1611254 RepID=A0A2G5SEY3_9PELO|nr:hypothetical protein B9Z55_027832 [Caenorhabditis nigoni]
MEELIISYQCINVFLDTSKMWGVDFEFDTADFSGRLGDILKTREKPLKTRKFSMGSRSQMDIKKILSAIDTHSLKIIELLFPSEQHSIESKISIKFSFHIDKLSKTDQWKNAEQLISRDLTITTPIQEINILHFVNLEIIVKTISSEDVAYLRTVSCFLIQKYHFMTHSL